MENVRGINSASRCMEAEVAGLTMARTPHKANARKQSKRFAALSRAQRQFNARRKGEPIIPDKILRKLAALHLPEANQFVYQACLEKLMREA